MSTGIIGVGHLARYLVAGLARAVNGSDICLSPRNRDNAEALAKQHGCRVMPDNQSLVDAVDNVILCVRPAQVSQALADLRFADRHLVISVCSGVSLQTLQPLTSPAQVVRAMPISAAAIGESVTPLYPHHRRANDFLSSLGEVIPLPHESAFEVASANAALYGWVFALMHTMVEANRAAGLPANTARSLVNQTFRAASGMSGHEPETPLTALVSRLATEGGITQQGLNLLRDADAWTAWQTAFAAVCNRLRSGPTNLT